MNRIVVLYRTYGQRIFMNILGALGSFIISYMLYGHWAGIFICSIWGIYYVKRSKKRLNEKRNECIKKEFCIFLEGIIVFMKAGYSMENAIVGFVDELPDTYGTKWETFESFMELQKGIMDGIKIESLMNKFGKTHSLTEIESFSDVLSIAKRADGNVIRLMNITIGKIKDEIDIKRELETIISGKLNELFIMKIMPIVMLLYLKYCMPEYFSSIHENISGNLTITILFLLYMILVYIGDNMCEKIKTE